MIHPRKGRKTQNLNYTSIINLVYIVVIYTQGYNNHVCVWGLVTVEAQVMDAMMEPSYG